jgi:hypothetical protein
MNTGRCLHKLFSLPGHYTLSGESKLSVTLHRAGANSGPKNVPCSPTRTSQTNYFLLLKIARQKSHLRVPLSDSCPSGTCLLLLSCFFFFPPSLKSQPTCPEPQPKSKNCLLNNLPTLLSENPSASRSEKNALTYSYPKNPKYECENLNSPSKNDSRCLPHLYNSPASRDPLNKPPKLPEYPKHENSSPFIPNHPLLQKHPPQIISIL